MTTETDTQHASTQTWTETHSTLRDKRSTPTSLPANRPADLSTSAQEKTLASVRALLDRLVRQERESMRLVNALAPPPQFDDLFELYRAAGFLYSAKSAALRAHVPTIERTYRKLLTPGSRVFRLALRFGIADGGVYVRNSISAFAYAPGTWQAQHLVSRQRHEYTGTLAVLIDLVQGLHDEGARHVRLSFRPTNPGTSTLFTDLARRVPEHLRELSIVDYGISAGGAATLEASTSAGVTVRPANDEGNLVKAFYRRLLSPVELASLGLSDPELRELDSDYRQAGLRRRRKVLLAIDHGEVAGACLV